MGIQNLYPVSRCVVFTSLFWFTTLFSFFMKGKQRVLLIILNYVHNIIFNINDLMSTTLRVDVARHAIEADEFAFSFE